MRIRVYLDDQPHDVIVGTRAAELLSREQLQALEEGRARLVDAHGNEVGSAGDLAPDQRLYFTAGA